MSNRLIEYHKTKRAEKEEERKKKHDEVRYIQSQV